MTLHDLKNQQATDHGFTDWQDLRESVQDDTEYENHWHAVCVRAQEQELRNAAGNAQMKPQNYFCDCVSTHTDWNINFNSITNKQNLVQ